MNDAEYEIFFEILTALKKNGIHASVGEIGEDAEQTIGYGYDCGDDNLGKELKQSTLSAMTSINPDWRNSYRVSLYDDYVELKVRTKLGSYVFEILLYGDINFNFYTKDFGFVKEVHVAAGLDSAFKLTILEIEVVKFKHYVGRQNTVSLVVNLPCPIYHHDGQARVKLEIPKSQIDEYLAQNFPGVRVTVIEV